MENIYCDESGNIFKSMNNFLQDSLCPRPLIILINFLCVLNMTKLWDELPQNIMP